MQDRIILNESDGSPPFLITQSKLIKNKRKYAT